jgi:hypothetical protein
MESVECLNGKISVGDRVAIAVDDGMYGGGMRIGEVLELIPAIRYGKETANVKAKITSGSCIAWGGYPHVRIYPYPKRFIKLGE